MKKIFLSILTVFLFTSLCLAKEVDKNLNIGLILENEKMRIIQPMLKKELDNLVGYKANIKIDDKNVRVAGWNKQNAVKQYTQLENSPEVDIIITVGNLINESIASGGKFKKPTICFSDSQINSIKNTGNLVNISNKTSEKESFAQLNKVYKYKKLAVLSENKIQINNKKKYILATTDNLFSVLKNDKSIDAVYLGYLGAKEGKYKRNLISELTKRGYPVFGSTTEDLRNGAYAVYASDTPLSVNIKKIAVAIDSYLDGKDLSQIDIKNKNDKFLSVNLLTARAVRKMPTYDVLSEAVTYNENYDDDFETVDVKQVMLYALNNNLGVTSGELQAQIAKREVQLNKRGFFPSAGVGTSFLFVNNIFTGFIPQRTGILLPTVNQLIYSDRAVTNILNSKDILKAEEYEKAQEVINAVKKSTQEYLNILKAKNIQKVYRQSLAFSGKNLKIREKAQKIGQIPMTDVYRWRSEYSKNKNDFIQASIKTKQAKISLNNILNKPLNTNFNLLDISFNDEIFIGFENQKIKKIVDNPLTTNIFMNFSVEEAVKTHPVIKSAQKRIEALVHLEKYYGRKNYIPNVALKGGMLNFMYQNGKGPPEKYDNTSFFVGAFVNWELFDGDKSRINRKKVKLEIERLKTQKKILQNNLELNIRKAVLELVAKSFNIKLSESSADNAEEHLKLVQKSYDIGKANISELLNALDANLKAEMQYMNSVYDYLLAVVDLQSNIGSFNLLLNEQKQTEFYKKFEKYLSNNREKF